MNEDSFKTVNKPAQDNNKIKKSKKSEDKLKREKNALVSQNTKPERTLKILEKDGFSMNDEKSGHGNQNYGASGKNIYRKRGK
jgi:cell division protein FtsL